MGKKVRSARGDMVDFDLIKIKEQIASRPTTQDVRARQDFIERKLHRRLKKAGANARKPAPAPARADVKVQPKLPSAPRATPEEKLNVPVQDNTKQKARPPKSDQ
jgi:hypothetical protein